MYVGATPGLQFGSLDLMGYDKTGPYYFEALSEDASFGNPEAVVREITSFLMDGGVEVHERDNNREITFRVRIRGEDTYALAAGEAALRGETYKRNTLIYTPPNPITGSAAPCVFDVVNSRLEYSFGDITELSLMRTYLLTIAAVPHARSNTLVEFESDPPPSGGAPTVTLVDNCESLTNWSGLTSNSGDTGNLSILDGVAIRLFRGWGVSTTTRWIKLTRSSLATSMTGTPFVRIKMVPSMKPGGDPASMVVETQINGIVRPEVARDGDYRWFVHPGGTLSSISIKVSGKFPAPDGAIVLRVDEIHRTSTTSLSTSTGIRQQFLTLPVGGSVRTQGNLEVKDETPTALGTVLVYTTPIDSPAVQPPLRRWRTSGSAESTDATLASGKFSDLNTLHTFDIPAPNVPAGGYLLLARIKNPAGTAYGLAWAGKSRMGSTTLDSNPPNGLTGGNLPVSNEWGVVTVGHMTLPTFDLGPSGLVRIELQTATTGLILDEAWLFNMDQGRLTWVEAGVGTPAAGGSANRVFIDSASLTSPVPSVQLGTDEERADAYGAGALMPSFGEHEFTPPMTNVFVVTTNSVTAALKMSHFPRFHTHVSE